MNIIGICIGLLLFNLELILGNELKFINIVLQKTKPLTDAPEIKVLWDTILSTGIEYETERRRILVQFGDMFENFNHKILKDKLESYLNEIQQLSGTQINYSMIRNLQESLQIVNDMHYKSNTLKPQLLTILVYMHHMIQQILNTNQLDKIAENLFSLAKEKIINCLDALKRGTKWRDLYKLHLQLITEKLDSIDINRNIIRSDGNTDNYNAAYK